jgi:hypothetical protein
MAGAPAPRGLRGLGLLNLLQVRPARLSFPGPWRSRRGDEGTRSSPSDRVFLN